MKETREDFATSLSVLITLRVCVKTCTYGFNKYIDTETMLLLIDLHQMNKSVTLCLLGGVEGWVGPN